MSAFIAYLIAGLALGCSFALVASGFVVIHRVTRVVNFAQGTVVVVGGLTAASMLSWGLPHPLAEVVAIVGAGLTGLVVGVIAISKRGTPVLASLVITLGLVFLAYALEIMVWGDQPISFQMAPGSVTVVGARVQNQYFVVVAAAVISLGLLQLFFARSYLGKAMTACASNAYAARLAGINVTRMGLLAFALAGLLGGLAGVLLTPLQPVSFDSDVVLATNGFAAAIFGGLMRPGMALVGGLVLGLAESFVAGYINGSYQTGVALILMLVLMVWQARRRLMMTEEGA